jgi:hypothetical protein
MLRSHLIFSRVLPSLLSYLVVQLVLLKVPFLPRVSRRKTLVALAANDTPRLHIRLLRHWRIVLLVRVQVRLLVFGGLVL